MWTQEIEDQVYTAINVYGEQLINRLMEITGSDDRDLITDIIRDRLI